MSLILQSRKSLIVEQHADPFSEAYLYAEPGRTLIVRKKRGVPGQSLPTVKQAQSQHNFGVLVRGLYRAGLTCVGWMRGFAARFYFWK